MVKYHPFQKEITAYKNFDCDWYGLSENEPCYGQVIEDYYYPNGYSESKVQIYYTCTGHYDCIEGGKYIPQEQ